MFATGKVMPGNSDVLPVSYGDDSGLYVEFYWREVQNEQKSLEEGRPIYESKEYIKIMAAGDKTKNWDRPVRKKSNGHEPSDLARFPRQWEVFQRQDVQVTEGTPVTEWTQITRADAAMLKSMNIHTIESLAAMSDTNIGFMGGRKYREMAVAWIAKAKDGASAAQWAKEKADMQAQIDAMNNQLQGFISAGAMPKQEASAPPVRRKRGPNKVKNEQNISGVNTSGS